MTTPASVQALRLRELIERSAASPYPRWRRMRELGAVHWNDRAQAWMVTHYAQALAALRDRRLGSNTLDNLLERLEPGPRQQAEPMRRSLARWVLYLDSEEHMRMRSLLARDFTPRAVARLRSLVEEEVEALLSGLEHEGQVELVEVLALPLPVRIISRLLGVPTTEHRALKHWLDDLAKMLSRRYAEHEHAEVARHAWEQLTGRFRALVEERRRSPPVEDLLGLMLGAEAQGRMDEEQILAMCAALLFGGSETTTYLIGNGVLALLAWPEEYERLAAEPGLWGSAVEELLRYEAPTQAVSRVALEDLELGGQAVRRGQAVLISLGSANRDGAQFEQPDTLDVGRKENAHLAFGIGPHFCLGAPLARLEGEVVLSTLLRRFPALRCETEQVQWVANPSFCGPIRLPLELGPWH